MKSTAVCLLVLATASLVTASGEDATTFNPVECPELVTRDVWGGVDPLLVENITSLPVPFVLIHHTYIPPACNETANCSAAMRGMQNFHMGKGWNDIGYNFLIGGDNQVYSGRGWDVVGAHSPKYNFMSVGISFIGDYREVLPTAEMMALAKQMIACGVERGSISSTYKLVGHRQVRNTECPGNALYEQIQHWPNWDPIVDIVPRT